MQSWPTWCILFPASFKTLQPLPFKSTHKPPRFSMINFKRIKTHRYEFSLYDIFTIFTIRKTKSFHTQTMWEISSWKSLVQVYCVRILGLKKCEIFHMNMILFTFLFCKILEPSISGCKHLINPLLQQWIKLLLCESTEIRIEICQDFVC